tara:strand:+ start:1142 stop:1612 length:471 start_codon:yes stop_codon:yes gene_type:complete
MSYKPDAPGTYQGKQVIINSDRLLFNAKSDAILLFSDKAIGFSTNGSFHFDTTNSDENKFVVNSPNIYLGLNDDGNFPTEPALLGDKTEEALVEILDIMEGLLKGVCGKVTFITGVPGDPTGPNPENIDVMNSTFVGINDLKSRLKDIKSKTTKLI